LRVERRKRTKNQSGEEKEVRPRPEGQHADLGHHRTSWARVFKEEKLPIQIRFCKDKRVKIFLGAGE